MPTSIALRTNALALTTGFTSTLTATITPATADDKTIIWTSSNESVATVAGGYVVAVAPGTTTITAKAYAGTDVTATCTVTVADATAPTSYATEIVDGTDYYIMNAATGLFLAGGNSWGTQASLIEHGIPFGAKLSEGTYTLDSYTYNNANSHFLNGTYVDGASTPLYITSLGDGKFSIATADGSAYIAGTPASTIVANTAAAASNSMAQWYFISKADRDKTLAAATAGNPVDATYYVKQANPSRNRSAGGFNVNAWSDYNLQGDHDNNVGQLYHAAGDISQTIDNIPNGTYTVTVQAFSSGSATFYANDEEVAVLPNREGIAAAYDAAKRFVEKAYTNTLTVTVTDRTLKLGLKSSDTDKWLVWDDVTLYMTAYTANTGIAAEDVELQIGQNVNLGAATVPATASFNALTYASADESIATVDAEGVVTGIALGSTTITVTANEMENFSKTVNVTVKLVTPTAFTLSETEVALDKDNASTTLTITPTPEGANDAATWTSSDETVATVVNGVVTAVSSGTATITATSVVDTEVSAQATITVAFPESAVPASYYENDGATRKVYSFGENLFKNGSFEYPEAVATWKAKNYATDAVASDFTINATGGVNDGAYITTNGAGVGSEKTIRKAIPVEVGKQYYFSVYTSGTAPTSTNMQYNALFKMSDANTEAGVLKQFEWPQGAEKTTSEWSKTECVFTAETPYVGVRMGWNSSSNFDEFVLAEVTYTTEGNVDYATAAIPTANIGDGAFQYSQAAIDAANALVQGTATVEDVEAAYAAVTTLNAPAEDQAYHLVFNSAGHTATGNALTLIPNSDQPQGLYGLKYLTPANTNLAQAFYFTHTTGNKYKLHAIDQEGEARYITTQAEGYGTTWYEGIRTITDVEKAMEVEIRPNGEGLYLLWNTGANKAIAHNGNNNNDCFTNNTANFQFAETTKPSVAINTTAAGWGTVILPFAVAELPEGVKAYTCAAVEGTTLTLEEVTALEANKPYIVEGAWNETLTGDAQGTALSYTAGLLTGTYADIDAPDGSYVLQNQDGKVGFYKVDATVVTPKVRANRAYLNVEEVAGVKAFYLNGNDADAIQSVFDGLRAGEAYDLGGRKISKLQKGVNIVGGRKVIVK